MDGRSVSHTMDAVASHTMDAAALPPRVFTKKGVVRSPFNPALDKYFYRRYALFSRYHLGVRLDAEGWFSATPEAVARRTSELLLSGSGGGVLFLDACVGCGGNAIQQALLDPSGRVLAVDVDPAKVALARHNARVYGVENRIEFVVGDFTSLAPRLRADIVFLSPPWGGVGYDDGASFRLADLPRPCCGRRLFDLAATCAPSVGYYLPASVEPVDLRDLARRHPSGFCDAVAFRLGGEAGAGGAGSSNPQPRKRAKKNEKRPPRTLLACFHASPPPRLHHHHDLPLCIREEVVEETPPRLRPRAARRDRTR